MQTEYQPNEFKILYQDDYLVAIHKPAGLLVHRSPIDKHETQFAVQITRDIIGKMVFPIHRLDKPTSGLLLFALDACTAKHLSEQFREHSINKSYLAICRGWTDKSGRIDTPLKYKLDKLADKNRQAPLEPQTALTDYRTIAQTTVEHTIGEFQQQRYSLVALNPATGRKHQLRRHLKHISHPIIGDVKHGDRYHNHFFNGWLRQHRLYLAATQLEFIHPITAETMVIKAPLETSFQYALTHLNLQPTL